MPTFADGDQQRAMSEPAPTAALDSLPSALRERIRGEPSAQQQPCAPPPRTRIATTAPAHVLYLVRTALRAERNPALEVALRIASAQGIPLVCVAVVEDSHPPAVPRLRRPPTDRSAAFRLEALSELQPAFEKRGTALWVHLVRDGCRAAVAMSLAARAALVVAEEHFGVEPHAHAIGRSPPQPPPPPSLTNDPPPPPPPPLAGASPPQAARCGWSTATAQYRQGSSPRRH